MAKKILIIGPWIGEFSYELCWWAPKLRKIKRTMFPDALTLCFGYEGREIIYNDFINDYISYDQETRQNMGYPGAGFSGNYETNKPQSQDPAAEKFVAKKIAAYNDVIRIAPYNIHQHCGQGAMGRKDTLYEFPYGDYTYLNARDDLKNNIKDLIKDKLDSSRSTIAVMARIRNRFVEEDSETLPKATWVDLISRIINELKVNVIMIGVPVNKGYPGSLDLKDTELFTKYPKNIISVVSEEKNSVERQIAILQTTKCSLYSSSGAAHLPFFSNTPMFCYTRTAELVRYKKGWIMQMTDNHKNNRICALYNTGKEYSATPVNYLFEEFTNFYNGKA